MDPRIAKLAKIVVRYSTKVKKGDRVSIYGSEDSIPLVKAVYKEVILAGGIARCNVSFNGQAYTYYKNASAEQIKNFPEIDWYAIQHTDVVIYVKAGNNKKELTNVDHKKVAMRSKVTKKINDYRVNKTRWCLVPYPTAAYAQDADMSLEEFSDYVFGCTNVDYAAMTKKWDKLKRIVDKGSEVHIKGKETDLRFSIKGRVAIGTQGDYNIPDGEVFTAPVENSAEGHILFDMPAVYGNNEVNMVRLWFKKGKCVKATAEKNEKFLKTMLDMDSGSRYLGEFGIGVNFKIDRFIKDILFDEKIGGTIHLALGQSYKWCKGVNKSALHWDMIKDLRKGGQFSIDGKVIMKNGRFLI